RSEHTLLLSGSHWVGAATKPRGPSEFLDVALEASREEEPVGVIDHVVVTPSPTNPAASTRIEATWPRAASPERVATARAVEAANPVDPETETAPESGPARRWHLAAGSLL